MMKPGMQRDLLVTFWLLFDEIRDDDPPSAVLPDDAQPDVPTGPLTGRRNAPDRHDS
jgi:hypothetical protein